MIHITLSQSRIIKKFFIFPISKYVFRVVPFAKLFQISTRSYSSEFLINNNIDVSSLITTKCA